MQISANAENLILEIILVYFSSPATRLSGRHAGVSRRIRVLGGDTLRSVRRLMGVIGQSYTRGLNETQTIH